MADAASDAYGSNAAVVMLHGVYGIRYIRYMLHDMLQICRAEVWQKLSTTFVEISRLGGGGMEGCGRGS